MFWETVMKKILLALTAAATLGMATLAPGVASAASTVLHVSPAGVELVRHEGHRYDRHDRRYSRHHARRHHDVRRVCETKRVRYQTRHGWKVKRVQECRVVRWR
jgi:hypothetical protein